MYLILFNWTPQHYSCAEKIIIVVKAEARFLTLPTIDFTTLTSILLVKAAFLLGNVDSLPP